MWYWRKGNHEGLLNFAEKIQNEPDLDLYAKYCFLREKGLRKQAFQNLNNFISSALSWSLEKRFQFVDSLHHVLNENEEIYDLIPQPLDNRIVQPTLLEWIKVNPDDPSGYRWLGEENNWRKALLLNSSEQISRIRLIKRLIYCSYFSTHHLPEGYIGNPSEDLMGLNEAQGLLSGMLDQTQKNEFIQEINHYRDLVQSYYDYERSKESVSFETWAIANDRMYQ
jgi:hypothetical protein